MEVKKENLSSIAVKNSAFIFAYAIISKIGGAIFIILIARLLGQPSQKLLRELKSRN